MLHKTHLMADEISREPQTIVLLAWVNYRGVYAILNINFDITAIAFISIIILFFSVAPFSPGKVLLHQDLLTDLPYGWIGALLILIFNTASMLAMIKHYQADRDHIYGLDIKHLDENRRR